MSSIIAVKNLKKEYNSQKTAVNSLRGIDLFVEEGDTLSIVGESGAGKSTLLHILGTLEAPTSGDVIINGVDPFKNGGKNSSNGKKKKRPFKFLSDMRSEANLAEFRNENIGFVFQFHHLLPEFTALENVMMPLLIRGTKKEEAKELAYAKLASVGLKDRVLHNPSELSGGEQQRVAIARAIILNPKIFLADEPTGNLDTKTSDKIHDLLMELNEEKKITMIIVTHNLRFAEGLKRSITLVDGKIV
ncbi:ABC transporter ATP-binding protein [Thermodesulfobacteriota bacterium]